MRLRKQKWLAVGLIAVLVITATTGAVYAYLSATTDPVDNTFTAAPTHTIDIKETFPIGDTNPIKENVCVDVGNPGYAVYVRAVIVVTWQNDKNEVYGQAPVQGTDYAISLNVGENAPWFYHSKDGFYYLKGMVISNSTQVLIKECYQTAAAPEAGYTLHVEIIAQTIQAKGSTDKVDANGKPIPAVTDAWKTVTVVDGKLEPKP